MSRSFNARARVRSSAPPGPRAAGDAGAQLPSAGTAAPCPSTPWVYLFWKAVLWSVRTTPGMCRARRKRWKDDGGRGCENPASCKVTFAPVLLLRRTSSKFLTWKEMKHHSGTAAPFHWSSGEVKNSQHLGEANRDVYYLHFDRVVHAGDRVRVHPENRVVPQSHLRENQPNTLRMRWGMAESHGMEENPNHSQIIQRNGE